MKRFFFTIIIISLISCSNQEIDKNDDSIYVYPNDLSVSNKFGEVKNYLTPYYPEQILLKDSVINTNIDPMLMYWFSNYLYAGREPILYNYYLNKDIVRFLWVRAKKESVIFNVYKEKENCYLEVKEFSESLHFANILVMKDAKTKLDLGILTKIEYDSLYKENDIHYIFKRNIYEIKKVVPIRKEEWNSLVEVINSSSFSTSLYDRNRGDDGSYWIVETHFKNRYWYTGAWNPNDDLHLIGTFIKKLSQIKEYETLD